MGEEVASALRRMRRRTEEARSLESRIALHFISRFQTRWECVGWIEGRFYILYLTE